MIIDAQVHAYAANTPERPWAQPRDWPPHMTGDELVAAMDAAGVDGAILVSVYTMYGFDAGYAIGVQREHPGRVALVKPVDPEDPAVADVIAAWKQQPGSVAVRIMMGRQAPGAGHPGWDRILRAAAQQDLPVNLMCTNNLDAGIALVDRHPQTRFVLDHLGLEQPHAPPAPPDAWAELPKVLDLARRPNVALKLTGVCTLSREPFPYADLWGPLARVFDAWGLDRCLWGTDFARASRVLGYREAVDAFRLATRLSASERALLMGGACAKVYGWSPAGAARPPR